MEADLVVESLGTGEIGCADGVNAGSRYRHHFLFPSQRSKVVNVLAV